MNLVEANIADLPKPEDMAICETYALQPEGWIHGGSFGDCEIQGQLWRVKREKGVEGWLGPVLFRYTSDTNFEVYAVLSWVELRKFMDKYDLVVF